MAVFDACTLDTELIELAKKLLQDLVQFCADFSFRFDIKDSSWQKCIGATVNDDRQDTITYKCKLKQNYLPPISMMACWKCIQCLWKNAEMSRGVIETQGGGTFPKCNHCKYVSPQVGNLRMHMKVHSGGTAPNKLFVISANVFGWTKLPYAYMEAQVIRENLYCYVHDKCFCCSDVWYLEVFSI